MSLCDPTEEYSHHTWGAEYHVRLVATKREQSCTQLCMYTNPGLYALAFLPSVGFLIQ